MKTLLVGNGLNRIGVKGISWEDVMKRLKDEFTPGLKYETKELPFPIIYEDIFLRSSFNKSLDNRNQTENEIKNFLKLNLKDIRKGVIHEDILKLDVDNIVTTNYDYAFFDGKYLKDKMEANLDWDKNPLFNKKLEISSKDNKGGNETKFRFRTYYNIDNRKFWHIHGEIEYPDTIVLGHEMYSNVISGMHDYFDKAIRNNKINIFDFNKIHYGWLDLLFVSQVSIIGLGLDFNEIDLWYALNQRARFINEEISENKNINEIVYYDLIGKEDKNYENLLKKDSFKAVLESHHIKYKKIVADTFEKSYYKFIDLHNSN